MDQEPLAVEPRLPPLSVVLTLDTSGSMAKRMPETRAAAIRFLDSLGREDSAQVVTFAREVRRLTAMPTDRQAMRDAIGRTAFFITRACRKAPVSRALRSRAAAPQAFLRYIPSPDSAAVRESSHPESQINSDLQELFNAYALSRG